MNIEINKHWVEYGLRYSIAISFLSAVADRLGLWPKDVSAWFNWGNFLDYTATLNPWAPESLIPFIGYGITGLECILAVMLVAKYKVKISSILSSVLLFIFVCAMSMTVGVKSVLDYGVLPMGFSALALYKLQDD